MLELRGGEWTVRIRATRTTPEGPVTERLRLPVGPSSKLRTRAAARLAADRVLAQRGVVHSGRAVAFRDYADIYKRVHLLALQPATQASYRSLLRCHLVPFLTSTLLQDIHPAAPAELIARMIAKKLGRQTISSAVILLGNILQKAAKDGYATALINRKAFKLPPLGVPKERRCLSPAESMRIIESSDWPHRAIYAIMAYQGLRCSEVLALEWRHVNLISGVLSVRQATTFGRIKTTKSRNSATDVPMPPDLIEILVAYLRHQVEAGESSGLLFRNRRGKPLWAGDVRKRHFRPLLRRLDIRPAGLHSFRHGFVTNQLNQGVSLPVTRAMARHGDVKTTMMYMHIASEDLRRAALASGQALGKPSNTQAANSDPSGPSENAGPQ